MHVLYSRLLLVMALNCNWWKAGSTSRWGWCLVFNRYVGWQSFLLFQILWNPVVGYECSAFSLSPLCLPPLLLYLSLCHGWNSEHQSRRNGTSLHGGRDLRGYLADTSLGDEMVVSTDLLIGNSHWWIPNMWLPSFRGDVAYCNYFSKPLKRISALSATSWFTSHLTYLSQHMDGRMGRGH